MGKQEIFVPDNASEPFGRTTHLAIAAHQDDIEIFAYHGVLECYSNSKQWFGAVVTADGAGSSRTGIYADYTDDMMKEIRIKEQKKAAYVGDYGFLSFLKYTSAEIKGRTPQIIDDYVEILTKAQPKILYTHNLADKHPTHLGVALKVVEAVRKLPMNIRPEKFYGCEVWRDLDWLDDDKKVKLVCDRSLNLERALLGVYDSQIAGGKRYDLATEGRRTANATYAESHEVDSYKRITYAMDLTPLLKDDKLDIREYVGSYIDDFKKSVMSALKY